MMTKTYGVCPKRAAPHKGCRHAVQPAAKYFAPGAKVTAPDESTGYAKCEPESHLTKARMNGHINGLGKVGIAHLLCRRKPSVQLERNPLTRLDCAKLERSANFWILPISVKGSELPDSPIPPTLTNGGSWLNLLIFLSGDSSESGVQEQYSGLPEDKHCLGSRKLGDLPSLEVPSKTANNCTPGVQKEKGRNTTLLMNSFLNHEENQQSPLLDGARNPDLAYENFVGYPFGSMPRRFSSCLANSLNQLLSVILSESAAALSCSLRSGCMRIWKAGDCPPVFGVRSFTLDIVHTFSLNGVYKVCTLYHVYILKQTPPNGISSTRRGLTTNDRSDIEVAMLDHTIHPQGRDSLTPNKFTWRFLALSRNDRKAKPCCLSVDAATEREARRILAPHFILSLAARLPLQGVMKTITPSQGMGEMTPPSTIEKTSIPPASVSKIEMEVRHA